MFCKNCGNEVDSNAVICVNCGAALSGKVITTGKSRVAAALLAFLFGALGIHKFYMGKPGEGVLYILFIWTFIPLILAFVEGVVYLCEGEEKFQSRLK